MSNTDLLSASTAVPHWYMYPPKGSFLDLAPSELVEGEIAKLAGKSVSAYVHIPFCNMKCNFCSLFTSRGHSDKTIENYVATLKREISNFGAKLNGTAPSLTVLYFGGGTPALLSESCLRDVLGEIRSVFDTSHLTSSSVEFSPDTADAFNANTWRMHGFNRASLGVQTFDDLQLDSLRRRHSGIDARQAIKTLGDAGYSEINVDLIFGYRGQTRASWNRDLETVLASGATHCTFHPLSVRPKTAIEKKTIRDVDCFGTLEDRHSQAIELFRAAGWKRTSAISYSKFRRGNPLEYAEAVGQATIGFGAGSRSYYGAVHTSTVPYSKNIPFGQVLGQYQDAILRGQLPVATAVQISRTDEVRRALILQMHHGFVRSETLAALDVLESGIEASRLMAKMVAADWFTREDEIYRLTDVGCVKAAEIGLSFSSSSVKESLGR